MYDYININLITHRLNSKSYNYSRTYINYRLDIYYPTCGGYNYYMHSNKSYKEEEKGEMK